VLKSRSAIKKQAAELRLLELKGGIWD